jgi:hypothetical protein
VDDVDYPLLCLMVGIGDKVDYLLMFNAKTVARAFRQNGSSLAGRISGD